MDLFLSLSIILGFVLIVKLLLHQRSKRHKLELADQIVRFEQAVSRNDIRDIIL